MNGVEHQDFNAAAPAIPAAAVEVDAEVPIDMLRLCSSRLRKNQRTYTAIGISLPVVLIVSLFVISSWEFVGAQDTPGASSGQIFLPAILGMPPTPAPTATPTVTPTAAPTVTPTAAAITTPSPTPPPLDTLEYPIVFVSRQIPSNGSAYYQETGSLPGVGAYSRFQVAAPGKLIIRDPDGTLHVLVDGSNPQNTSFNLIDVNAPEVSYDGNKIVFAGLPDGNYGTQVRQTPGAWRIYQINSDGTDLKQVTFSDQDDLDLSQFNHAEHWREYDDTDPAWLPDGRIVFSSTRWPSIGMYQDARTTNLYVVDADGMNLHRITAERNGADRPLVDPLTGRIVYSRWWRNFRNAANSMETLADPMGGYTQHLGLIAESLTGVIGGVDGADLSRNSWQLATVNPDGTELRQWSGVSGIGSAAFDNQAYGGSFAGDGSLYTNFFPMYNLTEAAGFGGIRRYRPGPSPYTTVIGVTDENYELVRTDPPSYHVFKSDYAADPEVLPNGRLLISWAPDVNQDYGLYTVATDGSDCKLLYDNAGTTEVRARVIKPRALPPIVADKVHDVASLLPPLPDGPYDIDGTFTFDALNIYANAPVDVNIANAIPVGSAGTIRFFIDHQRQSGAFFREGIDWPILLQELPVAPDGSIKTQSPANVPLFEQIRSPQPSYEVPLTHTFYRHLSQGAAHVAGLNFGRPGEVQRCIGCHAGHSMLPVPANPDDAQWSNLAPGATVTVSSGSANAVSLIDRRVNLPTRHWTSSPGQDPVAQWVLLTFPVPVTIRTITLYHLPDVDGNNLEIQATTVRLFSDAAATQQVAAETSGTLSVTGTEVAFSEVHARSVRIEFNSVAGTDMYGNQVAGLAEIEVIARGETNPSTQSLPRGAVCCWEPVLSANLSAAPDPQKTADNQSD